MSASTGQDRASLLDAIPSMLAELSRKSRRNMFNADFMLVVETLQDYGIKAQVAVKNVTHEALSDPLYAFVIEEEVFGLYGGRGWEEVACLRLEINTLPKESVFGDTFFVRLAFEELEYQSGPKRDYIERLKPLLKASLDQAMLDAGTGPALPSRARRGPRL